MTSDKKSERFFKVLHDRLKRAQQETKSTVAVNMSDLGSQPREDREQADPTSKGQAQGAPGMWAGAGDKARVVSVGMEGEGEGMSAPSSPSLTRPHPAGRVASFSMPSSSSRYALGPSLRRGHEVGERVQSNEMGTSVLIMQPILRFLQLLCENHNRDLQVWPRPAPPLPAPGPALPRAPPPCAPLRPRSAPGTHPLPSLRPALPCTLPLLPKHAHTLRLVSGLATTACGSKAGEAPIPAAGVIVVPRQAFPPCCSGAMHVPLHALQNFLRCQNNKTNYNLVCETLQFLDIMCGSTTGGLGLLGLYINEDNVGLVIQTLETLTEYCQGPCHENQVSHGSRVWLRGPGGGQSRPGRRQAQALGAATGSERPRAPCHPHPCLPPDLHRDARVQRHRHHHRADSQ